MSVEHYAQKHPFRAGVAGNVLASAIWWIGGKVMTPIISSLSVLAWSGFGEWLHDLGWLLFLLALTNWFLFGRRVTFQPATNITENRLVRVDTVREAREPKPEALSPFRPARLEAQAGATPTPDPVIDPSPIDQSERSLNGELDWSVRAHGPEILVEVTNVNPTGPPKIGIAVWIDDLRKWSDRNSVFVKVRAFEDARKPGHLLLTQGHQNLYFDEFQRYAFLPVADANGVMRLQYLVNKQHHPIAMEAGTWRTRIRVEWDGRSEARDVCFRSEGAKKAPVLVECPMER